MGQAVLPFFEYLAMQGFVLMIGLCFVQEEEINASGILKYWIFGQMMCFAVLQILAVPMILTRLSFNHLFWSYCVVLAVVFGFGMLKIVKKKARIRIRNPKLSPLSLLILMVVMLLFLWQAGTYFFGTHLDEDDARWLAEANDALVTSDMMTRDFDTGEYINSFTMNEDVSSPWPMLFAILSRVLFNSRVSVIAHTVFPPIELLVMYGIFWLIGEKLFKKKDAQLTFLLFTMLVTVFYGMSSYTQGRFALVRIWQGKATVAAVAIPFIIYLSICINKENRGVDWIMLIIAGAAVSLMSGMGIVISGIMIGVYGLYNIIAYQNWKRIPLWLCSLVPSVSCLLINYYLRG